MNALDHAIGFQKKQIVTPGKTHDRAIVAHSGKHTRL